MYYEVLAGRHPDGTRRCIGSSPNLATAAALARKHGGARIYDVGRSRWVHPSEWPAE